MPREEIEILKDRVAVLEEKLESFYTLHYQEVTPEVNPDSILTKLEGSSSEIGN